MITPSPRDESGLSLVELIVVIAVSGLFLSLIAVIFTSSLTAQRQATESDAVTAQLNAATASITESVRGSVDASVSATGQRLDAKVLLSDGDTWECRAWQVQGGELRYSAGTTARPAVDSSWRSLASGVTGNLTGGAAFEESGTRISLGFDFTQGDAAVAVSDGANSQVIYAGGTACW